MNITTNQPTFTSGKLIFVKNNRKYSDENMFPKEIISQLEQAKKAIAKEKYDLFIIQDKYLPGYYEFNANTSLYNAITNRTQQRTFVEESILESSFLDAVKTAIENFKNIIRKK